MIMGYIPRLLYRGMLPTKETPQTVTVPQDKRWIVTNVVLTSSAPGSTVVAATVELAGVPLIAEANLDPGSTLALDCAQVLDPTTILTLYASAAETIAAHVSGVEADL